jgi:predicted RNA-binding protein (TIGR00451 family)
MCSVTVKSVTDNEIVLRKIRSIADYQLGKGVGEALFPNNITVIFSKRTGKIRHIYLKHELLATLRPTDGMFSLTIAGAERILNGVKHPCLWVKVQKEAAPFIAKGKSVFAKYVADSYSEIRPQEEVIVIDEDDKVLAVGRAVLTGKEMKVFKSGVAVRVRRGAAEVKSIEELNCN